jgi:SAM-dependent methyltransferase
MISKTQIRQHKQYILPYHWLMIADSFRGRDYYGYVNYVLNLFNYNNKKILDAGSGDGKLSSLLRSKGATVTGIDYSQRAINLASVMELEVNFVYGSILDCAFENKFDFIFLIEVLEHLDPSDVVKALSNLKNTLSVDGKIIISFPSDKVALIDKHFQHFNEDKIKKIAQEADLKIDKIINFGFTNKFLNIAYRLLDNRYYNLKLLSKFFNKKIYPKFLLHQDGEQSERYILIFSK